MHTLTSFTVAGKQSLVTTLIYYKPVVLKLFWLMDHLSKKISDGPLFYADTTGTSSQHC